MKRKLTLLPLMMCLLIHLNAGNYKSFKVSVYTRAYEVEKMKDLHWLDSTWNVISKQIKVDKIYLETHRDLLIVPDATLEQAKKFFHDRGVETGGGITYTINEANSFETFCYSDPEHRKLVQEIAEHTAKHFDDYILDDFFFTSCKSDIEIEAKGTQSWTDYRLKLMYEAGENLIMKPSKKVNPKVKIIIKYPNWYDHFQGLGFDLDKGPYLFDGVWTGTETRDPGSDQHLQNYLSYNVITYFENLRPGHNFGGWVDSGGSHMGEHRYAEQLWLTMFAKTPEIMLFAYNQLLGVNIRSEAGTVTLPRAAATALEQVDKFVYKLGKPIGIKSYKPAHSLGDDFLQNYLGMIGLPMDMHPEFPTDQQVVLLTEQAKYDDQLITKMKAQLQKGGDVVITSSLLKAIPDKIANIAEVRCSDLKALVNDFGRNGKAGREILIPQVRYQTNDSWEMVSAGRPLDGGVSGYPILLRAPWSKGNMFVLTIPDDMGNLYDYPQGALNIIRRILSQDLNVRLDAPAKVSLFMYDNGTFIVESFNDEPVDVKILTDENITGLKDMIDNSTLSPNEKEPVSPMMRRYRVVENKNEYSLTIKPHTYRVFEVNK